MATKTVKDKPDPILSEAPTVEIAGETYELRRLGLRDVFKVARVLGNGIAVLGDERYGPGQVLQVLIASMAQNEEEVLTLVADVLGLKRKDLDDPERFPMESIVTVFEALSEHQDIRAFLAKVEAMMKRLPEMQQTP